MSKTSIDRFSEKYEKNISGCWNWTAAVNKYGYGTFWNGLQIKSGPQKVLAHRWSYEFFNGPIEDGFYICHSCDNTKCVNPKHLFKGTQKDNVHDSVRKGRHAKGKNVLTDYEVRQLLDEYTQSYGDIVKLSIKYNICKKTVFDIVHQKGAYSSWMA